MKKIEAYCQGLYVMAVPPVSTVKWNVDDWIRWIDQTGYWTVRIDS
jgi:Family of unknown function (DUF5484)